MDKKIKEKLKKGREEVLERILVMYNKFLDEVDEGVDIDKNTSLANMFASAWKDFSHSIEDENKNNIKIETYNIWQTINNKLVNTKIKMNNIVAVKMYKNDIIMSIWYDDENNKILKNIKKCNILDNLFAFYGPFLKLTLNEEGVVYVSKNIAKKIYIKENTLHVDGSIVMFSNAIAEEYYETVIQDVNNFEDYKI